MIDIDHGYEAQGYVLPRGYTWERVARERVAYVINEIYVPLALGPGCCAWGVPMIDGQFLSHEDSPAREG